MSIRRGPLPPLTPPFINTYSLDFDGVDDYVDCGTSLELKPNIITVSCWVKGSTQTAYTRIVSQDGPTGGADAYGFYVTPALNKVVFAIKTDITGTVTSATSGVVLDNNWHHLVGTYDGSEVILYVDGVAIGSPVAGTSILNYGIGGLTIGCFSEPTTLPSYLFNGNIDEVSIFDSIIPIGDLWDGSEKPTDLTSLSPIAWYRMGDNGSYKSPQWLIPSNENKDKVSNYSFAFDGIDDYVEIPNITPRFGTQNPATPDSATNAPWSVSIWAYIPSGLTTTTPLFNIPLGNFVYSWKVIWGAGQIIQFGARYRTLRVNEVTTAINTNQWNHIVVTFDGVDTNALTSWKLFINGVNITNLTSGGHLGTNGTGKTYIARDQSNYGEVKIDELSLYDIKLTDSNVTDIYNGGEPTTISGAIAHYKIGEEATFSTNWTVPDAVGSNNGTSNGMLIDARVGTAPSSSNNAISFNMDLVDRVTDVPT